MSDEWKSRSYMAKQTEDKGTEWEIELSLPLLTERRATRWIFDGFIIPPSSPHLSWNEVPRQNEKNELNLKSKGLNSPNANSISELSAKPTDLCSMSKMIFRSSEFLKIRKQYSYLKMRRKNTHLMFH